MNSKPKIIAVVGPTSSGKTSLSIDIAEEFCGEVISADSRQVYRGLDIGSGKVTKEEMRGIKHHLLDIADPMDIYTAADFELDANEAIKEILKKGNHPIVAGGTFFYLDILRGKQQSAPVEPDESFRASLFSFSNDELFHQLKKADPNRANNIDQYNRPRLIRALEIIKSLGKVPEVQERESPFDWLIIGLKVDKVRLYENIHHRLVSRIETGMAEEVEKLHRAGVTYERMHQLGLEYRYLAMHLQNQLTHVEMMEQLETKIRQFAKRQMSWLKRDKDIEWYTPENREAIFARVQSFLYPTNS